MTLVIEPRFGEATTEGESIWDKKPLSSVCNFLVVDGTIGVIGQAVTSCTLAPPSLRLDINLSGNRNFMTISAFEFAKLPVSNKLRRKQWENNGKQKRCRPKATWLSHIYFWTGKRAYHKILLAIARVTFSRPFEWLRRREIFSVSLYVCAYVQTYLHRWKRCTHVPSLYCSHLN